MEMSVQKVIVKKKHLCTAYISPSSGFGVVVAGVTDV